MNMKLKDFYKILALLLISTNVLAQSTYNKVAGIPGDHDIINISTTYNSKAISGQYLKILGSGNSSVTKPFIIVEGIDFLNDQDFPAHLKLYNAKNNNSSPANLDSALVYNLHREGYDVIILDFDNATDYIQNNAMLLVALINSLNLTEDNLVVMGYSMGGLVARYALTWMESQGQNHHTRLYVSHDAPHKGANFPLGFQELLEDVRDHLNYGVIMNILLMTFEYNMPAARQMLVYHYLNSKDGIAKPSDDKLSLFNEMYNMNPNGNGYPSIPVKIAISNGNRSGIPQYNFLEERNLLAGDEILHFNYIMEDNGVFCSCGLWYLIWHGKCDQTCYPWVEDELTATVRAGFDDSKPLEEFSFYSMGKRPIGNTGVKLPLLGGKGSQTFDSRNYAYDIAPSSNSPNFIEKLKDAIETGLNLTNVKAVPNTCFIPTISALDLNIGLSESFGLNNSQCKTSFDYIHAETTNNNHFLLTAGAKNFILDHLSANESPINRVIYDDVNIDIANKTVNSNEQYDKTAANTITNSGSFVVKSGGSSKLVAGNSIHLKPGLRAESGSNFRASIAAGQLCSSPVEFNPHYIYPLPILKSSANSEHIILYYDCSNYEEMPSYDPNYLYFNCYDSIAVTTQQLDSLLNKNISVYPSPTMGIITIAFSSEIILEYVKVKIYDYMGNLVYSLNNVSYDILSIDVSNAMTGVLTIEFNLNNGSYIYTRKILKE